MVVESESTHHVTFNKPLFLSYHDSIFSSFELGKTSTAKIITIGTVEIPILVEGNQANSLFQNIYIRLVLDINCFQSLSSENLH